MDARRLGLALYQFAQAAHGSQRDFEVQTQRGIDPAPLYKE
jgi:hypothetical protein